MSAAGKALVRAELQKKQTDIWSGKLNALLINLKEKGVDQEGFLIILNCPSCIGRPLEGYLGPFLVPVYDKRMEQQPRATAIIEGKI